MTGKCLKLTKPILAIDISDRDLVVVPVDSTIKIEAPHVNDERLVDVLWGDRIVAMFAADLEVRGYEVRP
jgi:hypothetical protein